MAAVAGATVAVVANGVAVLDVFCCAAGAGCSVVAVVGDVFCVAAVAGNVVVAVTEGVGVECVLTLWLSSLLWLFGLLLSVGLGYSGLVRKICKQRLISR